MSTSSFASLLRSSKFATHDPTITRIYTASNSARAAGDWGLKYSLPPSTNNRPHSRYIRVRSLDAGQGLGCDYLSGEKEARFMQTWGDGRFGWSPSDSVSGGSTQGWNRGFPQAATDAANRNSTPKKGGKVINVEALMRPLQVVKNKPMYMPDLEAMSEHEFEKYLEGVRGQRGEFKQRLDGTREQAVTAAKGEAKPAAKESEPVQSLFEYERDGLANHTEHLHSLASSVSSSPTSLAPQPHPTFGLAYSQGSLPETTFSPLLSLPGRVLNSADGKAFRESNADDRAREKMERRGDRRYALAGNTEPGKVVGIGGVTAAMRNTQSEGLYEMDPVGGDPFADEDSISQFRVESAQIIRPPIIINPQAGSATRSTTSTSMLDPTGSGRKESDLAGPLRDVSFKASVSASGQTNKERAKQNLGAVIPGQKGWVGGFREEVNPSDHMFRAGRASSGTAGGRGRLSPMERQARVAEGRDAQMISMEAIAELLGGMGRGLGSSPSKSSSSSSSPSQKRSYHSSAIRRHPSTDSDLPTANITPGSAKGSQPIQGPGVGKPAEGDNLAEGEWRQLEENVAGEEKYGEPLDKGKKQVREEESVNRK